MNIEIIGGGTISHVRNHLALCAPAYGTTARQLGKLCYEVDSRHYSVKVHLTKMAGGNENLETNEDVSKLVDQLVADKQTRIIFFNPALVDFSGSVCEYGAVGYDWADDIETRSGKYEERLKTSDGRRMMRLNPAPKILGKIRKERKDIFLVAFKTTCGATQDEQFLTALHLLKTNSCNLVLANDTKTRVNMIITPEQARYSITTDRAEALRSLVKMTLSRADGTFTRSTVVPGDPIPWNGEQVPQSLRTVVDHCIKAGAYKPFNGSTVGHFAFKVGGNLFITSKRRVDFNELDKVGMVLCEADGDDKVVAFGAKPSVGGQSQRIVFREHRDMDCIVHFHCPPKYPAELSVRSQMEHECGSHECGKNTSNGLREEMPGIKCVYLDNHGPNIVFNKNIDPKKVIDFIDRNFDLTKSTDGIDRSKEIAKSL
jgi:hypothetical protein